MMNDTQTTYGIYCPHAHVFAPKCQKRKCLIVIITSQIRGWQMNWLNDPRGCIALEMIDHSKPNLSSWLPNVFWERILELYRRSLWIVNWKDEAFAVNVGSKNSALYQSWMAKNRIDADVFWIVAIPKLRRTLKQKWVYIHQEGTSTSITDRFSAFIKNYKTGVTGRKIYMYMVKWE